MAAWGTAALLPALPWVAMRFTDEVRWTGFDFAVFAALLAGAGAAFELALRATRNRAYRVGAGVALAAAFLLVWVNGAVGIIGSEDHPANLLFGGVIATAAVGAALARLRARPMAAALGATALAQAGVGVIAAAAGWGFPAAATAGFCTLWLSSAWLFSRAERQSGAGHRSAPR